MMTVLREWTTDSENKPDSANRLGFCFYNFCGSETSFVCGRFARSVNFTHMQLRHSFARPRFAALYRMDSLFGRNHSLSQIAWTYLS
jgi:hypothetical protein